MIDPASLPRAGGGPPLVHADLAPTWHEQFGCWLEEAASRLDFPEPNAMVVATVDPTGEPSARTVLLKAYDERGLVFFTNYTSRKGRALRANPRACCVFGWHALQRQVIVCGRAELTTREESEHYFHSRPHGSQIAASVGEQSEVIQDREWLTARRDELAADHPEDTTVPLPDFWGGVRVVPDTVEFWAGRDSRLHDRLRYRRAPQDWVIERLAP